MASKAQLQAVAANCSQFQSVEEGAFTSSVQSSRTCENCKHFTKDNKCDINLVDEILENLTNEG
ncbi:hypothetical protein FQB35_12735 [Crassaminicella thermophila]|uniref:Uncharacterized protein n=1 Tax=Crassaminicella thermophila TaxID=2599308 RepID=A0A5C0SEQ6_CRATE|nr:hypothetical protein [Crassaminicella thermophila]QEK13115.1 hypothetical protein FQB35_12735 [Crassaminicella thermophila]